MCILKNPSSSVEEVPEKPLCNCAIIASKYGYPHKAHREDLKIDALYLAKKVRTAYGDSVPVGESVLLCDLCHDFCFGMQQSLPFWEFRCL